MVIVPHEDRTVDPAVPVGVTRCPGRAAGPWFTITQRGSVVGHAREIALRDARLQILPSGRPRICGTLVEPSAAWLDATDLRRAVCEDGADGVRGHFALPERLRIELVQWAILGPSGLWVSA